MNPGKNNDFDRQLAGKFNDFRPEVPNGLWDKIASKLDAPAATTPYRATTTAPCPVVDIGSSKCVAGVRNRILAQPSRRGNLPP